MESLHDTPTQLKDFVVQISSNCDSIRMSGTCLPDTSDRVGLNSQVPPSLWLSSPTHPIELVTDRINR